MSTSRESTLGETLKALGIALLNATLILVILAALALGYAVSSIRGFAANAAQETVSAAVEASGIKPSELGSDLDMLSTEIAGLRSDLEEGNFDPATLETLETQTARVEKLVQFISEPEIRIPDATIDNMADSLNRLLSAVRSCPGA